MECYQVKSESCFLQVYSTNPSASQTVILFLHGGPGSGAKAIMELPAFQTLSQEYHCVYFDQRGSGESFYDLRLGLSIQQITQDVLSVVQDVKKRYDVKHFFLWGGSFGGCLASLCLERFPTLFHGVILSSPAITFHRRQALSFYKRMQEPYKERLNNKKMDMTSDNLSPEKFFSIKEVKDFVYSQWNSSQSLRHICAMSSWFYQHPFHQLFENTQIPILVLQGKDDKVCIYENIDTVLNNHRYSNVEYYLFENCGHEVFCDKEVEFINKIQLFIRRIQEC